MSVDGSWKITVNSPVGKQEGTLELRTEAGALTGKQTGPGTDCPIRDAKLEGENLSWTSLTTKPFPMNLKFAGVVNGDTIEGKVKAGSFGSFAFTGARA